MGLAATRCHSMCLTKVPGDVMMDRDFLLALSASQTHLARHDISNILLCFPRHGVWWNREFVLDALEMLKEWDVERYVHDEMWRDPAFLLDALLVKEAVLECVPDE